MLGHIHYSTNVYKKIGTKSTDDQEVKNLRQSMIRIFSVHRDVHTDAYCATVARTMLTHHYFL